MSPLLAIVPLLFAISASFSVAGQTSDPPACRFSNKGIKYPKQALTYPMSSDRYAVQYKVDSGNWTNARVYISYYGGTMASPFNKSSGYTRENSMSFVSIPAKATSLVQLRVTRLFGSASGFQASDNVSVRPSAKTVGVNLETGGTVLLSTITGPNFAGDQFLLWWGDATQGGAVEALAFFLNPPYDKPTGSNVKTVTALSDLTDVSAYDTLDFEGTVTLANGGASAFVVPANISDVFLAPGAWVQGKLRFAQSGQGNLRRIYGPGVLDVSRFEYDLRTCSDDTTGFADQGYHALSWEDLPHPNKQVGDRFVLDGIVVTDHNHATADLLVSGAVNNVKSVGWNGLNGGFRLGDNTTMSNVFLRSADDSIMMWGASITVTNATVWQNYNGAAVNLGWGDNSPGDDGLIDGLYVVKTDWNSPTDPSFSATNLNGQNNAVIASLMVPNTMFGTVKPSVYRNIVVEDAPRTLLSLKIVFPECNDPAGPREGKCSGTDLTLPSVLNLRIENVLTPPSIVENSIGFQTVNGKPLTGTMDITLTNVLVKLSSGKVKLLTAGNPSLVGGVATNGANVHMGYNP